MMCNENKVQFFSNDKLLCIFHYDILCVSFFLWFRWNACNAPSISWHFHKSPPRYCTHQLVRRGNWFQFENLPNTLGIGFALNFVSCPCKMKRFEQINESIHNANWLMILFHLHVHFAGFFMIAKWAIELRVKRLNSFSLWWWLALCFTASHSLAIWILVLCDSKKLENLRIGFFAIENFGLLSQMRLEIKW